MNLKILMCVNEHDKNWREAHLRLELDEWFKLYSPPNDKFKREYAGQFDHSTDALKYVVPIKNIGAF